MDYAELFISKYLFENLVSWTNARADQHHADLQNGNAERRVQLDTEAARQLLKEWPPVSVSIKDKRLFLCYTQNF